MKLRVDLRKHYGPFELHAEFASTASRLGVFGRSGGGKSTLVHMIAGLVRPDSGTLEFDGKLLYSSAKGICLPPEQRRIAVVFQHAHLFPHLSVRSNLFYGYRRTPTNERRVDPDALIEVLDLGSLLARAVRGLSGGERQRVALGRALLASPRLLLMDEPLSALDEALKYQIIPYLAAAWEEFAIPYLIISHSMNEMRLLTEEVIVLHHGQVSTQTNPDELARQRMGWTRAGYINLLHLSEPLREDDLLSFPFGSERLVMWAGAKGAGVFELSSKDIMLFRGHPGAISARNLLRCRVSRVFELEKRVGVELDCGGVSLIATVVPQAARDLDVRPGGEVYAIIKASAFRRLY